MTTGTRPLPSPQVQPQRKNSNSPECLPEKENQAPKPLRPLPTHKDAALVGPVPVDSFYAGSSSSKSQVSKAGSSHTVYAPPTSSPPPSYHIKEASPFREPELVSIVEDEPLPALIPANADDWPQENHYGDWGNTAPWPEWSGGGWDTSISKKVDIDGRNEEEELRWSNKELRGKSNRPGPGVLPPLLLDLLHTPEHTLYSVIPSEPPAAKANSIPSSISNPPSSPVTSHTSIPNHKPTTDEMHTAIPHPNAYYCKEHNGWVLLCWRSSSVLPPIVPSFSSDYPFPDQARRKLVTSCVGDDESSVGDTKAQANKTHHFHKYERAVDSRTLATPFKRSEWEREFQQKQRRRKMTLHLDGEDTEMSSAGEQSEEPQEDLLDLYICCQCEVYCLVSQVIPGVIPLRLLEEFNKDKLEHPPVGKTGEMAVVTGWETIVTILENKLWKGENRILPVTRPKFQSKLGWNICVRRLFEILDFKAEEQSCVSGPPEMSLLSPSIDSTTPDGKRTRSKLLRAWVEISSWLSLYHKTTRKDPNFHPMVLHVKVVNATEMSQTGLGAHINQIPRGLLPDVLVPYRGLDRAWNTLGLTPTTYSPELLMFAYLAQCRCDPANTILYFSQFYNIVDTMKERGASPPEILELLVAEERSRSRFTDADLHKSLELLGFGKGNILDIELDDDVSDNFVIQAWKDAQKRAWQEPSDKAATLRSDLNDALKIVADFKDSPTLLRAWERGKAPVMTEDTAYSTLEVPKEVDETMLLTIFNLRIEDQPTQADKMREALTVIAEIRNSQRLREFISSGRDPEDIASETRLEMPRGLNQLGNTCYLNSLLQYFYTIKDLRLAISASINDGEKSLYDLKFTDDDLKHHRVGGRLVTRREIQRSKRFVHQLANLFWNMEYCDTAAVTPTKELAQLALITSQDEEEDDQGGTNTDASNDTDATLVEDGPVRPSYERSSQSPSRSSSSPSVLGKRVREFPRTQGMDVDGEPSEADKDGFVMVSKPTSPPDPVHSPIKPTASSSKQKTVDNAPDVEMQDLSQKAVNDAKPPPLPPRKPRETSDSTMMFGRQHDVSECMDNCMFQIETALLDLPDEEMAGAESDKTSVIKRLFYGKKRQRLTPLTIPNEQRRRTLSMHDKEDLFSHLHVNVSDEGFDLYDGLSRYFDDIVEVDGVKKRMEVTLVDLPPLLQIQLQRVQFDRDTQQAYKSQAYVKFGDTIYMDRFLDSADSEKKSRSKDIQARLTVCRDRIQKLTQGKHAPFAPALGETAHFLSNQKVLEIPEANADLTAKLKSEQAYVVSQLEQERASSAKLKKELEEVWKSDAKAAYQLTSVFIHRGSSPSFGHYFFYARNLPERPDQWFKYNDSTVSVVSKDEVLADTTGSTANPYMLVFARKDAEVIDTVHRFDPTTLEDA